jgi:excisionase family DNA binding protein
LTKTSTNIEKLENYISQVEAAKIRGVSKQAIADLIKRQRLTAIKVAGRTLVLRTEVEAFVAKPNKGRPPKSGKKTTTTKVAKK